MTDAAIQGDYCDLRFIKGRKICQIVVEIPIEAGASFVAMFGTPDPSKTIPVALARIDKSIADKPKGGRLAQRAGIICSEGAFAQFIQDRGASYGVVNTDPATFIRVYCDVESRRELDHNPEAARKFLDLVASYEAWKLI